MSFYFQIEISVSNISMFTFSFNQGLTRPEYLYVTKNSPINFGWQSYNKFQPNITLAIMGFTNYMGHLSNIASIFIQL